MSEKPEPAQAVVIQGLENISGPPPPSSLDTSPEPCPAKTPAEIAQDIITKTKGDDGFVETWHDIVANGFVVFGGKKKTIDEVTKWVHSKVTIPMDPSIMDIAGCEQRIGTVLLQVDSELAHAEYGERWWAQEKKKYLARAKDKRKSRDVIEAELMDSNADFCTVSACHLSADSSYKFWKNMRTTCLDALDRLRQISIALTAEMKKNNANLY
jgi:hypothetical protein